MDNEKESNFDVSSDEEGPLLHHTISTSEMTVPLTLPSSSSDARRSPQTPQQQLDTFHFSVNTELEEESAVHRRFQSARKIRYIQQEVLF